MWVVEVCFCCVGVFVGVCGVVGVVDDGFG